MRTFVSLVAWFAARAGADIKPATWTLSHPCVAVAATGTLILGEVVRPNRAGRLVPLNDDGTARPFAWHWALWLAVALIMALLAAGYLRRRWKGAPSRPQQSWPAEVGGKDESNRNANHK
jgi:hypothetical protein